MWNKFSKVAVLLVVVLALPMAVMAQEHLVGRGTLVAEGDGVATLIGRGAIRVSADRGDLYIIDRGGDAHIVVTGNGRMQEREFRGFTLIHYQGFDGTARIRGSEIAVRVKGQGIQLQAAGEGRVILKGQGWYEVNGHRGNWTEDGVVIRIDSVDAMPSVVPLETDVDG